MKLMDKAKQAALAAAVKTGLGYLEKDPEVNIPKLMELVDKFVPDGWYESQRNAIRNAIQNKDTAALLMGATVRRSVPQGELITQDDVLYPGNPGFLAAVLSPGKRAVSIPTSAVSSNSGLVSAGDWVDVILTLKRETAEAMADQEDKTSGMTKLAAQTILTNVRVLALNNSTESIAPQPETAPQKTDAKKTASTGTWWLNSW